MLERLQREIIAAPMDQSLRALHQDLVAMAGLGKAGKPPGCAPSALTPTVNVEVALGDHTLRVFSLLSTFGTAQDVTTDELRIATFFPADEVTAAFFQSMAADGG
jgi:hypothetical protein